MPTVLDPTSNSSSVVGAIAPLPTQSPAPPVAPQMSGYDPTTDPSVKPPPVASTAPALSGYDPTMDPSVPAPPKPTGLVDAASSEKSSSAIVNYIRARTGTLAPKGEDCGMGIEAMLGMPMGHSGIQNLREDPANQVKPDASGKVPDGTGVWFGGDTRGQRHYGIAFTAGDGDQYLAEVRWNGPGTPYHYDSTRKVSAVANERDHAGKGIVYFKLPATGVNAGSGPASTPRPAPQMSGYDPTADPSVKPPSGADIAATSPIGPVKGPFQARNVPTAAQEYLQKVFTPGVGTRVQRYLQIPAGPAVTDELPGFNHPATPAHYATEEFPNDPTKLLPPDVKATPVAGMQGYTQYKFKDGSTIVLGPNKAQAAPRAGYAGGTSQEYNTGVYASIADATGGRPMRGGTHQSYPDMPRPEAADKLANTTGQQFYADFLPQGIESIQQDVTHGLRKAGLSENASEDVGGAVAAPLKFNKFTIGIEAVANAINAASQTQTPGGQPATTTDRWKAVGGSIADLAKGFVSGPDAQHVIRGLSLLAQNDPNQAKAMFDEFGALGQDVATHPLSTVTMLALAKGEKGVPTATEKSLGVVENGWRSAAQAAWDRGDYDAARTARAQAEKFGTARQWVLDNEANSHANGLTLNPKTWLANARQAAQAGRNVTNRASAIAQAFDQVASTPSQADVFARSSEGNAGAEPQTFLGMPEGTPPEAITQPEEFAARAQKIAAAFAESEPTAARSSGPLPEGKGEPSEEAPTVLPDWDRPTVNKWTSTGGDVIRSDQDGYHLYRRGESKPSATFDTLHQAQEAAPPVAVEEPAATEAPRAMPQAPIESPASGLKSEEAVDPEIEAARQRIEARKAQSMTVGDNEIPEPDLTRDHGIVANFPIGDLHVDPDRFQYKIGTGANGVASSSDLGEAVVYNPRAAGLLDVWKDPEDGKTYVVNGHNRYALANRTGQTHVNVHFIDADTPAEARFIGAASNVMEGQGTPFDAAKLFRDSGMDVDDLKANGISMKGRIASQGLALSRLSPSLFTAALNEELPIERATLIGSKLPDHAEQAKLMELIDKRRGKKSMTNDQISELIDDVKNAPKHTSSTDTLFGADETTQNLAIERAGVAAHVRRNLLQDANALSGAARNADRITSVEGNAIEAGKTSALASENRSAAEVFDRLKNSSGPVSDILNKAAKRVAAGEKTSNVYADALKQYKAAAKEYTGERDRAQGNRAEDRGSSVAQSVGPEPHGTGQAAEAGGDLFGDEAHGPLTEPVTAPKPTSKAKQAAQRAQSQAQARIDARNAKGGPKLRNNVSMGGVGAAQEYIEHATDYAIVGAAKMAQGVIDKAEWVRQMVHEFGEDIRPYLDKIFEMARDRYNGIVKPQETSANAGVSAVSGPATEAHGANPQVPSDDLPGHSFRAPTYRAPKYATSINLNNVSDAEVKTYYESRAKALADDNPYGTYNREETLQRGRALGLTAAALARLPREWIPPGTSPDVWLSAIREVSDAAAKSLRDAERMAKARPTAGNLRAVEKAKALADTAADRRGFWSNQFHKMGMVLQSVSDPFTAAKEGDIFRQVTKATNFKKPLSVDEKINSPNFGKSATTYTSADYDAAMAKVQERFQKTKDPVNAECRE